MDASTMVREATWMIPLLLALLGAAFIAVIGLVVWLVNRFLEVGHEFKADVMDRLSKQDAVQADQSKLLGAIKDLLAQELSKIRERIVEHEIRIKTLEDK